MTNASSPTDHALLISLYIKAIQAITGSQRKIAYHIGMYCAHTMFNLIYTDVQLPLPGPHSFPMLLLYLGNHKIL